MRIRFVYVFITAAAAMGAVRLAGVMDSVSAEAKPEASLTAPAEPSVAEAETLAETAPASGEADKDDKATDPGNAAADLETTEPFDPNDLSGSEIRLLQDLANRRDALRRREQDLTVREGLLRATEKRIDEKLSQLSELRAELQALVDKKDGIEEERINRLVKIYSKMKPKDAAEVFARLEMPLLLDVLERMKEIRSAPILALLDPARASDVTEELARRRKMLINLGGN